MSNRGGADKKAPIIYPMGKYGMLVKHILNDRYGIQEAFVADNLIAEVTHNSGIYPISKIKDIDMQERTVLLSSDPGFSDVRAELLKYTTIDHILDVFSPSLYFDKNAYTAFVETPEKPRIAMVEATARDICRNGIQGAVAECGVNRGGTARYISMFFPDRKFYLFDTFKGFDVRDVSDEHEDLPSDFWQRWDYTNNSAELALKNIPYRSNCVVREGYFPETAKGLEDERFAFVSLDMDLYKPVLAGLEFFYPRMNPGGVIFIDDFMNQHLFGVRKAVIEFCKRDHIPYVVAPQYQFEDTRYYDGWAIIQKPL